MTQTLNWSAVVAAVPRERFIPDVIWRYDRDLTGNDLIPVDRRTDPDRWAAMVADDRPVLTQVDNGRPSADGAGAEASSSCSDRRVVRSMLELLAAEPGDRLLEIGTGTGWNAALLAESGATVTSIEIDSELAARARALLGGSVEVHTGDGSLGWAAGAPYDRVISTVGTDVIPWSWIEQTRPGGRIVAPLDAAWYPPGLAVVTRVEDGAAGSLAAPAAFMVMRAQAQPRTAPSIRDLPPEHTGSTKVHPYYLSGDRAAAVAIGQWTDSIRFVWRSPDNTSDGVLWLYGPGSWATIDATTSPPYDVEQAGPRRLADEVLDAYQRWRQAGEPAAEDWSVTVTRAGQSLSL